MNWILGNKNKNSSHGTILQKAKLWWGGISRDKKIKTLGVVLFLVCVFCLAISTAYAADNTPAPTTKSESGFSITGAIIDLATALPKALIGMILAACQGVAIFIVSVATTIFAVTVDPSNMSGPNGILNQQALKDIWVTVRDTLNMFFILVLLFSAFCTIFQVEKWNLKKVWLNILINALLVNFSFPIARIIIDVSNVAMYYFINHLFAATATTAVTGSSIFASFGSVSKIGELLAPANYNNDQIAFQIAMIIFTFIMGMTLLIVAILFVIRLIALTLLIMFSPIGFVGYIFPATASYADDWWKKLFSYSFFAPIMIFGMAIALQVSKAINENSASFTGNASTNSSPSIETEWVAKAAFFAIPIVILWAVMGVAKGMGIAGADTVVNAVKKGGKSLAMKMSGGNWAKKNWEGFSKQRKARQDEIDKKRFGVTLGKKANKVQDTAISKITGEKGKAAERLKSYKSTEFDEAAKKHAERIKENEDANTIATNARTTISDASTKQQVADFIGRYKQLKEDPAAKSAFESNIRSNAGNINAAFTHGQTQAAAAGHRRGSDEFKAAASAHQSAHMESLVSNGWSDLNKQHKNAQKHFRGEEITP